MIRTDKDPIQRQIEITAFTIWVIMCGLALLGSLRFFSGVLAGGILCIINYMLMCRHTRLALSLSGRKIGFLATSRYLLRLTFLGLAIFLLITQLHVHVIGLLLGLSVAMLGIISYACYSYIFMGGNF